MDLKLTGKVALITGSSRGIGLATAKAFAAEGCRLILSARSAEQLADAEAGLRTNGAEVAAHAADVSKPDVYAHQWQVGDLVVWDNGFTMHRRTPFDPGARRLMKRMTMNLDRYHHVIPDGRLAQSEVGMPI